MPNRPLVLDLDFTLLHLEFVPGSIEVPGRTRSAWIAPATVAALGELQSEFEIVLATARSWDGTRWVCDGLRARGVEVKSVVIEDGARCGQIGALRAFAADFDAPQVRASLVCASQWPRFEWQLDFENCVVARCENGEQAGELMTIFQARAELKIWTPRFFRDGRKVYILPRAADKWSALQRLLGERALGAAGVGDGANDLVWLGEIELPATFGDVSPDLLRAVRARGGIVGSARSHEGIAAILTELGRKQKTDSARS